MTGCCCCCRCFYLGRSSHGWQDALPICQLFSLWFDVIVFRAVVGSVSFVKIRFQSCKKLSLIGSEAAAIQEEVQGSLEFWCIFLLQFCNNPLAIAIFSRHTCRRSIGFSSKNWRRGGLRDWDWPIQSENKREEESGTNHASLANVFCVSWQKLIDLFINPPSPLLTVSSGRWSRAPCQEDQHKKKFTIYVRHKVEYHQLGKKKFRISRHKWNMIIIRFQQNQEKPDSNSM